MKKQSRWMKSVVKTAASTSTDMPWSRQVRAAKRNSKSHAIASALKSARG
jgi:hypothetical protein